MTNAELISSLANRVHIEQDSANLTGSLRTEIDTYYAAEQIDFFHKEKLYKELRGNYRKITGEVFPETPSTPSFVFKDSVNQGIANTMTLYTSNQFVEVGAVLYTDPELTEPLTSPFTSSYLTSEDGNTLFIMSNVGEIVAAIGQSLYVWNEYSSCESSSIIGQYLINTDVKSTGISFFYWIDYYSSEREIADVVDGAYVLSPLGNESNSYTRVTFVKTGGAINSAEYCLPRFTHSFKTNLLDISDTSGAITLYTTDEIVVVGTLFYTDEILSTPYAPANPNTAIYSNYLIDYDDEYYIILSASGSEALEVWTTLPQVTYVTNCDLEELGTHYLALGGADNIMTQNRAHLELYIGYTRTQLTGGTYFESNGTIPVSDPGTHIPAGVNVSSNLIVQSVDPNPCYYA